MSVESYLKEHTDKQRGVNLDMILAHSGLSHEQTLSELARLLKSGEVTMRHSNDRYYRYAQAKRGWLVKEERQR
jgi:hypothetical protein